MGSYYERVNGHIKPSEIARSEDINKIQTNIQTAFTEMIKDIYGDGCILDEDEEALKLTPTSYHIDQQNKKFNNTDNIDDYCISFYDRYFRQKIELDKSEIQSIRVQMHNKTQVEPTIFAEIRDLDMNLKKEANVKLPSTIDNDQPIDVDFVFNLEHLDVGDYYFIIRPVDINLTDFTDATYDTITPNSFLLKFDQTGSYNEGLEASYNGVDYLNANELEDQVEISGEQITISSINYDLYFEEIYSTGNTYLITPGACLVQGKKVFPVDTHVTIDGPSKTGDRIDLVTLSDDGKLYVQSGQPYTG